MKTLKNPLFLLVLMFGFLTVGCSDDDDNNGNRNFQNYRLDQFGNCVDQNNRPVQNNLCNNQQGQRQYTYDQQGRCIDIYTRQPVQFNQEWLCQQQGNNVGGQWPGQQWPNQGGQWPNQGGNWQGQVCTGTYYTQWGSQVWCQVGFNPQAGSSCAGQQLYDQWGQFVYCR